MSQTGTKPQAERTTFVNVLIISDDPGLQTPLKQSLEAEGFRPVIAGTVISALETLSSRPVDLILLDPALPGQPGLGLLKSLRYAYKDIPVILLTSENEMNDKLQDSVHVTCDCLTAPFEAGELMIRIRSVMDRMKTDTNMLAAKSLHIGIIEIDRTERTFKIAGQLVKTTSKEFGLMWLLCENPKKVFSRERLLDQVWGCQYCGQTRSVDMTVKRLREKMKPYGHLLATVHGLGYKVEV